MLDFTTTLLSAGGNNTAIELTEAQLESLGRGKRVPVTVTIGDYTFRNTTAVMGSHNWIGVNAAHRAAANIRAGDEIHVHIEVDDAPRTIAAPPELAAALAEDAIAAAAWEKLSYSHKRQHAEAITGAKAPETKARRVAQAIAMLRGE